MINNLTLKIFFGISVENFFTSCKKLAKYNIKTFIYCLETKKKNNKISFPKRYLLSMTTTGNRNEKT